MQTAVKPPPWQVLLPEPPPLEREKPRWRFPVAPPRGEVAESRKRRAADSQGATSFLSRLESIIRLRPGQHAERGGEAQAQERSCGEEFVCRGFAFEDYPGRAMPYRYYGIGRRQAAERAEGPLIHFASGAAREELMGYRDPALRLVVPPPQQAPSLPIVNCEQYTCDLARKHGTVVVLLYSAHETSGFILEDGSQRLLNFKCPPAARLHEGARVSYIAAPRRRDDPGADAADGADGEAEQVAPLSGADAAAPAQAPARPPRIRRRIQGVVGDADAEGIDSAEVNPAPQSLYDLMLSYVRDDPATRKERLARLVHCDLSDNAEEHMPLGKARRGPPPKKTLFQVLHPLEPREPLRYELPVELHPAQRAPPRPPAGVPRLEASAVGGASFVLRRALLRSAGLHATPRVRSAIYTPSTARAGATPTTRPARYAGPVSARALPPAAHPVSGSPPPGLGNGLFEVSSEPPPPRGATDEEIERKRQEGIQALEDTFLPPAPEPFRFTLEGRALRNLRPPPAGSWV